MYTRFRLVPKLMTLNDLWARFKVIDSLNAVKMVKYSLVMTPTPCRVAGCITSVRRTYAHLHLFTYTVGSGRIKLTISPKRLKIQRKLLLTAYVKSSFWLQPKCMTLNDLWARFKVIDFLTAAKMAKCGLIMTSTPCIEWPEALSLLMPTYSYARALSYFLTQNSLTCVFGDWPGI